MKTATPDIRKILIFLPEPLLKRLDQVCRRAGENRNAFIQRAILLALKERDRNAQIMQYVAGYRKNPETSEEIACAQASASRFLAKEPWGG